MAAACQRVSYSKDTVTQQSVVHTPVICCCYCNSIALCQRNTKRDEYFT
jgi:hypothetical protein